MTRVAMAFLAAWLVLLVGCTTTEPSKRGNSAGPARHPDADVREEHVIREEPVRAAPAVKSRSNDGLYWTEHAYPTGDRSTSVVLLESGTPSEVTAGTCYEYVLRATNLTNQNLDHVEVKAVREGDVRITVAMTSDQLTRPVDETEATRFYK